METSQVIKNTEIAGDLAPRTELETAPKASAEKQTQTGVQASVFKKDEQQECADQSAAVGDAPQVGTNAWYAQNRRELKEAKEELETLRKAMENMTDKDSADKAARERDALLQLYRQEVKNSHMALIKAHCSGETAQSVEELGETFLGILANREKSGKSIGPKDVIAAYEMSRLERTLLENKSAGPVVKASDGTKEFYSPSEVDALSKRQLNDPTVLKRIIKSMKKWK